MLVPDRHRRLLDQLRQHGSAQVEQLSVVLGVSPSTVRRDLALLEADGRLLRAHGGAYLPGRNTPPAPLPVTDGEAKQRIGRAAAERVADGMTIMILPGTTTSAMLPHLGQRTITVVTNGLEVGHALAAHPDITVVLLGGVLHRDQMTLLGPLTERSMADLHVDLMFAGAYGISPDVGVTGAKVIQAGYHHSMLRHTDALIVLADAEKFGRQGPTLLAGIDQVDTFVTDHGTPEPLLADLRSQGAAVVTC